MNLTEDRCDLRKLMAMTPKPRESLFFRLVIVSSGALLLTVLAMIAAAFSRPDSSLSKFFDQNGLSLLGLEVLGILGFGILAMACDGPPRDSSSPNSAQSDKHDES